MKQSRHTWPRARQHVATAPSNWQSDITGQAPANVCTDDWCIECRSWSSLPAKVTAALEEAERGVALEGQTPIAVLHQLGGTHDRDLVVLRWKDFAALLVGRHPSDQHMAARVAALLALVGEDDET